MDIIDRITEKMNTYGFDMEADMSTNIKNIIYGDEEQVELPHKLFTILKMRMRDLSPADITLFKQYGHERNDIVVNIKPKKFDIRWDDIKVLANKFGLTGLKYEDHQIRMWFRGDVIWDVIR
jgi:hypothetical protein